MSGRGVIRAAQTFLSAQRATVAGLTREEYTAVDAVVGGSVGGHVRHTLDHFTKCLGAWAQLQQRGEGGGGTPPPPSSPPPKIRYDTRKRGVPLERDPVEALRVLDELDLALEDAQSRGGGEALRRAAVAPAFLLGAGSDDDDEQHTFSSNAERELFFCCHHGFHHEHMIAMILRRAGKDVPEGMGLAPSTARHALGGAQQR